MPDPVDATVEAAAEAIHATEYPAWSDTAHRDSNRWSWRGDGHGEAYRDIIRDQARAALAAAVPIVLDQIADEIDVLRPYGHNDYRDGLDSAASHVRAARDRWTA